MTNEINNTYFITIDRELIHEYHQYYMKKHPSARSYPFAKPKSVKAIDKNGTPILTSGGNQKTKKKAVSKNDYTIDDCLYGTMSLNELLIINNRMTMNNKKQQWGDLGIWIAKKYGLNDLQISNALTEYRVFGETNAQRDADNISAGIKMLNDGLYVKSKMFIDDNWKHINPLLITLDYDKNRPRTEIRISTFDDNVRNVYEKLKIHIENFKNI
ncbi:hypothetical protein [Clostridium sp.]|uniref:hypothetical protein n=1 Tax=Clostridium sp. TaxID=1506 RepID=UPI002631D545|nr:hypothetical protein [Clostridium sp.]